jgi:prefoldin subunit 5
MARKKFKPEMISHELQIIKNKMSSLAAQDKILESKQVRLNEARQANKLKYQKLSRRAQELQNKLG